MIESSLIHDGYTADLGPSRIALQSLTAPTQAERDVTNSQLHAAGMARGSGSPQHPTGKKDAVAVSHSPTTTPYMVYFFD